MGVGVVEGLRLWLLLRFFGNGTVRESAVSYDIAVCVIEAHEYHEHYDL